MYGSVCRIEYYWSHDNADTIFKKSKLKGRPGKQFSIYCTFPDHIQPTLTGHFQFKVQNYGIAYQRILETAHQSIGLNAN